jgi:hypothetical protein
MGAGRAFLDPADCQGPGVEIDLIPAKINQFGGPQAMPIGHGDHGGIAVTPSVGLNGIG